LRFWLRLSLVIRIEVIGFFLGDFLADLNGKLAGLFLPRVGVVAISHFIKTEIEAAMAKNMSAFQNFVSLEQLYVAQNIL
jgi:hypothetical protein